MDPGSIPPLPVLHGVPGQGVHRQFAEEMQARSRQGRRTKQGFSPGKQCLHRLVPCGNCARAMPVEQQAFKGREMIQSPFLLLKPPNRSRSA